MAPGSVPYTLVGFAPEVDWRPLHFVEPIPKFHVCSACGLVRKYASQLPCLHVLCWSCYEQCAEENALICPLDGQQCRKENVQWKDLPAEEMLRRVVRCWNEEHGCTVSAAASEIFKHFLLDCAHHPAKCPKCSTSVRCSDVCSHLRSQCAHIVPPLRAGSERQTGCLGKPAQFLHLRHLQDQTCSITLLGVQFVRQTSRQCSILEGISERLAVLKEALRQNLAQLTEQEHHTIEERFHLNLASIEEMKACLESQRHTIRLLSGATTEFKKTLKELVNAMSVNAESVPSSTAGIGNYHADAREQGRMPLDLILRVLRNTEIQNTQCEFFVKYVRALEAQAVEHAFAPYESKLVYLRGYLVSPGVCIRKDGERVNVFVMLRLHKGELDDILVWPFEYTVRFSVVHPLKDPKRQFEIKTHRATQGNQKPIAPCNAPVCYAQHSLDLVHLIRDGYVHENQLRVQVELLP